MRSVSVSGEVNHPDVFELRPDKLLIDPNFQGYKLSLESLPSYDVPLPSGEIRKLAVINRNYIILFVNRFGPCYGHG